MRVLHLRNTCGYYGAERCIVSWMRELGGRGFTFDLVAYDHPDPSTETFYAEAREAGAEVHRLPRDHRHGVSALGRLVSVVRRRRVELIHAHENRSHMMGWLAGGITGTPVMGSVHGYVAAGGRSTRLNRLNRWFLSGHRLARLTAPTEELVRQLGVAELVPNAIAGNGAADELAADALPQVPTFGVVSRLSPEKNVAAFLSAIASLPSHWRFEVLGEGPEADRLHDHPEAGRVGWCGFQPDAAERMRGWTALVIPSRSEGLPLTLLEAMAAGVPVVATAVGGIPDAVENGHHAILVPRDDPGALGDGMRQVVADPAGARVRAEAARARFRERYTLTRVGDDLERLYRSVARGRS